LISQRRGAVFSGWLFPKITSITLVIPVVLLVLVMSFSAEAQSSGKLALVGVLYPGGQPLGPLEAFREGLRERGYVEGRNLKLEWRFAEGHNERLPRLARELVSLKVDAIFAINTQAAQAAKSTSETIPIVIARVADPVRTGLVASFAHPGGNVTGLTSITEELAGKRLQLLREALPKAQRVAAVWNSGNPGFAATLREMEAASPQFGLKVQALPVRGVNDLPKVFEAITNGRADVVFVLDDVLITSHKQQIMEWATKSHLPVISIYREFADAGALIAYGPSIRDMYRRAAYFVDKILKGAKPGDLPIEQPTKVEFVINLKTAKALGVTVPPSLLLQADKVIE
jgi:putative ABC transport system substrate-binding protein